MMHCSRPRFTFWTDTASSNSSIMSPANTCSAWLSEPAAIVVFKVATDQLRIEAFELAGQSSKSACAKVNEQIFAIGKK